MGEFKYLVERRSYMMNNDNEIIAGFKRDTDALHYMLYLRNLDHSCDITGTSYKLLDNNYKEIKND